MQGHQETLWKKETKFLNAVCFVPNKVTLKFGNKNESKKKSQLGEEMEWNAIFIPFK